MTSAPIASPNAPPTAGAVVLVRTRAYLVEAVQPAELPGAGTRVTMACLEDDAQGEPLEFIWELELDARVLDREAWKRIRERGFDDARWFYAYIKTSSTQHAARDVARMKGRSITGTFGNGAGRIRAMDLVRIVTGMRPASIAARAGAAAARAGKRNNRVFGYDHYLHLVSA